MDIEKTLEKKGIPTIEKIGKELKAIEKRNIEIMRELTELIDRLNDTDLKFFAKHLNSMLLNLRQQNRRAEQHKRLVKYVEDLEKAIDKLEKKNPDDPELPVFKADLVKKRVIVANLEEKIKAWNAGADEMINDLRENLSQKNMQRYVVTREYGERWSDEEFKKRYNALVIKIMVLVKKIVKNLEIKKELFKDVVEECEITIPLITKIQKEVDFQRSVQ